MLKTLVIGNSPLPLENTKSRPAAGLRTWQFLKPLLDNKDLDVTLIAVAMPECYGPELSEARTECDGYVRLNIPKNSPHLTQLIQHEHDKLAPDVILSINTYPSYLASKIKSKVPLWADLNGWAMAEAQAQAYKTSSNDYIPHYFAMEESILRRADKISTVSEAQKYSVIGELAMLGRLNKETFGYDMVSYIPNASEFKDKMSECPGLFEDLPRDAFIALWAGGYNTWVDEQTLFKGLEHAMEKCPNLHFVSTGGKIEGLDSKTFANFRKMIDESPLGHRFKFLGWVSTQDMPYIYKRAHCGLNVDTNCVETSTGARNRINEMMKHGLPVITTLGSEISQECNDRGAGLGVASGSGSALGEAITNMYRSKDLSAYETAGKKYILQNNYRMTTQPLLKWLKNPERAPDSNVNIKTSGKLAKLSAALRYLRERGLAAFLKKLCQALK